MTPAAVECAPLKGGGGGGGHIRLQEGRPMTTRVPLKGLSIVMWSPYQMRLAAVECAPLEEERGGGGGGGGDPQLIARRLSKDDARAPDRPEHCQMGLL